MRTIFAALLIAAPLSAQQPAGDAIPRELALALIDRYGPPGKQPEIFIGRAPPSFPTNALPRNPNILGGVERAPAASVVIAFREPADSALPMLVRQLERARWERETREQMEGFVPAPSGRPHRFCRDDASLTLEVRERPGGGSLAHLSSWMSRDHMPCDEDRWRARLARDRLEIPALHAPTGARSFGSGRGGGGWGSVEAYIRLETTMHSIDLAAHYAKQLADSGWTITGPTVGQGAVLYGVRRREGDDKEQPLTGVLFVIDIPGTQQREAVLRVARIQPTP
jgi:hypothetical protein